MKRLICLLSFFLSISAFAQDPSNYSLHEIPKTYIGLGTGINNSAGFLNLRLDARVGKTTLLDLAAGVGTWGYKLSAGAVLNVRDKNTWCPAVSVSWALGEERAPLSLEVNDSSGNSSTKTVDMKMEPTTLINLSVQRQWITKKANRFYLEFGFSIPVNKGNYSLLTSGYSLTDTSKKGMEAIRPGGLMISFAYEFKL